MQYSDRIFKLGGDITNAAQGHVIHGCNMHGVMGSGVAKAIREKWPEVYEAYRQKFYNADCGDFSCDIVKLGDIISVPVSEKLVIHNALTQINYGNDGKRYLNYEALYLSLVNLREYVDSHEYAKTISFPSIGCGLAGGNWNIVSTMITEVFHDPKYSLIWYVPR